MNQALLLKNIPYLAEKGPPFFLNSDKKLFGSSDVHPFNSQSYMFKIVFIKSLLLTERNQHWLS